jgi:hypothetical protein
MSGRDWYVERLRRRLSIWQPGNRTTSHHLSGAVTISGRLLQTKAHFEEISKCLQF